MLSSVFFVTMYKETTDVQTIIKTLDLYLIVMIFDTA